MNYDKRIKRIRQAFLNDGMDALLLTKGTDIRYLSGFTGEAGTATLVLTQNKQYLITDGRFTNQAKMETTGVEVICWQSGVGLYKESANLLNEVGATKVAFNGQEISYTNYKILSEAGEYKLENDNAYVTKLRMVKDEDELDLIRKACAITEQSFMEFLNQVKPGQTEKDIRNILEYEFRKRGSTDVSFQTIIASGPENGGNPHASLTDRIIKSGDMITVDFGAKYEGYCSDITRTFALGEPDRELKKLYQIVYESKKCAEDMLKAGVTAKEIDYAARSVIEKAGYNLPHGLGHGFGLDIHEDPFLGFYNTYEMEEMVVHTIEPGIYVPGLGGVRIEDDYLILKDGAECLTPNIPRELIML